VHGDVHVAEHPWHHWHACLAVLRRTRSARRSWKARAGFFAIRHHRARTRRRRIPSASIATPRRTPLPEAVGLRPAPRHSALRAIQDAFSATAPPVLHERGFSIAAAMRHGSMSSISTRRRPLVLKYVIEGSGGPTKQICRTCTPPQIESSVRLGDRLAIRRSARPARRPQDLLVHTRTHELRRGTSGVEPRPRGARARCACRAPPWPAGGHSPSAHGHASLPRGIGARVGAPHVSPARRVPEWVPPQGVC
jgi:hypothetical protein